MKYKVFPVGNQFAVYKIDSMGNASGNPVSMHTDQNAAQKECDRLCGGKKESPIPENVREAICKTQFREVSIPRASINKDKRTFEVAFSSETPVKRWWGTEILDHAPGSVDLSRLLNNAPLLEMHDPKQQIGVVENARIDPDRVGRATVRMSKNAKAEEVFGDIQDGIRTKISVGYEFLDDLVVETRNEEGDAETFRAMKWMPIEISSVSIAADDKVGVGRSKENKTVPAQSIEPDEQIDNKNKGVRIMADEQKPTPEFLEQERVKEIEAIVTHLGTRVPNISRYKEDAIKMKIPADVFRGSMYLKVTDDKPLETSKTDLDLSEQEKNRYSVTAAIRACLPENQGKKSREREISDEIAKRVGKDTEGIYLSPEALYYTVARERALSGVQSRASLVTTSTSLGGALVGTLIQPGQFIDLLRNRMKTAQAGVTMLTGLQQNIAIPKQTAAGTAYWVADDAALTASNPTFGQLTLQPHTVGAYNDYSRLLLMQSTPSVDALVVNDLTIIIALAIDAAVLNGSGNAGQPVGILNWPSLTSNSDATITWAKIVQHESDVATANADVATMGWMVLPSGTTGRGKFKTTVKVSGYPVYLMADDGTMNGYPVYVTNQMPAATLLFGDWSQAVLAEWGVLNLTVDPYTGSSKGTIRVVAFESVDVGVRQVGAFSAGTSIS